MRPLDNLPDRRSSLYYLPPHQLHRDADHEHLQLNQDRLIPGNTKRKQEEKSLQWLPGLGQGWQEAGLKLVKLASNALENLCQCKTKHPTDELGLSLCHLESRPLLYPYTSTKRADIRRPFSNWYRISFSCTAGAERYIEWGHDP